MDASVSLICTPFTRTAPLVISSLAWRLDFSTPASTRASTILTGAKATSPPLVFRKAPSISSPVSSAISPEKRAAVTLRACASPASP